MSDDIVVTVDGEIDDEAVPLTEVQAKQLDKKIRAAADKLVTDWDALLDLLEQAASGQIYVGLGLPSWAAWFRDAVKITPADREERKALVDLVSGKCLSQRTIAAVIGVSRQTVNNDLHSGVKNLTPDPPPAALTENTPGQTDRVEQALAKARTEPATETTGEDGKSYPRPTPLPPSQRDIDRHTTALVRDIGSLRTQLEGHTERALKLRGEEGFDQSHRERMVSAANKVINVANKLMVAVAPADGGAK